MPRTYSVAVVFRDVSDDRERWNERYRSGEFSPAETPSPLVAEFADSLPEGRVLDVATGTGRDALFLAERGYEVDALDISDAALAAARERAAERSLTVNWVQADVESYCFPERTYDVVTVSFFDALGRLSAIKRALKPGGILLYEHHLQSNEPIDRGPNGDRYRFGSNDLLRACLDLTVLQYEETTREEDGRTSAVVTLVARNSSGDAQQYPRR